MKKREKCKNRTSLFFIVQMPFLGRRPLAEPRFRSYPGSPIPGWGLFSRFAREALPWLSLIFAITQGDIDPSLPWLGLAFAVCQGSPDPGWSSCSRFARAGLPWLGLIFAVCQGSLPLAGPRFRGLPGKPAPGRVPISPFPREAPAHPRPPRSSYNCLTGMWFRSKRVRA